MNEERIEMKRRGWRWTYDIIKKLLNTVKMRE